ncbi:MAG: hypothetical protein ACI3ZN_10175 [Candidatus Cryptobacteroides sp.]
MGKYDDIINMEHPTSQKHPRMPMIDRAAQFSAFAALTGYEDIISETGRLTDSRPELDEEQLQKLDESLNRIQESLPSKPKVKGIRFIPDSFKEGGRLEPFECRVRNIDYSTTSLLTTDGVSIPLYDLCELSISPTKIHLP